MKLKQQMFASAVLFMKITMIQIFMSVAVILSLQAKEANAQAPLERKVSLNVKSMALSEVLDMINKQANVDFTYSVNATKLNSEVTCALNNVKISEFLDHTLAEYHVGYRLINNRIVLFQIPQSELNVGQSNQAVPIVSLAITGKVTDTKGEALPGATVIEKGTSNAVPTDINGKFKITVADKNAVLIVRYVGYLTKEVGIDGKSTVNIVLEDSQDTKLNEVVVVGYGKQKEINRTGSSSSISTKELVQSPVANISNSLVGRLPGLFASQAGGEPGNDASNIRIRGTGTYTGNTSPLLLVDGIEVLSINNIDPNEVASLTILKDATSTAVYGIRGANGVIIVTTKRGKEGPPRVSYSFNQAFNSFTRLQHTINSVDYATGFNQALLSDSYVTGANYVPKYSAQDIALFQSGADPIFHSNTDWAKLLFKNYSLQSQHNLNVSGGQKSVKYYISAGFFDQNGLFTDTKQISPDYSSESIYKRYNFRSNFNFDVTSRFKLTLDLSTQSADISGNNASSGDSFSTVKVVADILRTAPTEGPGQIDGKIVLVQPNGNNPYNSILNAGSGSGIRRQYDNTLNGLVRLDHELDFITKGFRVHGDVALTTFNSNLIQNGKAIFVYTAVKLPDGSVNLVPNNPSATPEFKFSTTNTINRRLTAELGFDYNRTFFNDHNVTGLLLYNQQKTYDPSLLYDIPKGYQSYVGRVTYAYKSRYLAEFDGAYNGTENFAPGKRFGFFPAYSIGWVPTEESFFPKNKFITYLKFRASYGEVGNDNIGGARFLYNPTTYTYKVNTYYFGNYGTLFSPVTGDVEGKAGNSNITWERSKKTDIGTDFYLFNGTIKVTADYFNEDRRNILSTPNTISLVSGILQPAVNLGRVTNKGFDGEISYTDHVGRFDYRIAVNYSYAHNTIVFQDEIPNANAYQNQTGQRVGQYYGIPVDGIYNTWAQVNVANRPVYSASTNKIQPGDFIYRDVNGDGIINQFDQVPVGYANAPEKTYGISLGGSYKGFDLSILLQGVGNVSYAYNGYQNTIGYSGAIPQGGPDYLHQWTADRYAQGLPINAPRASVSNGPNGLGGDYFIADASYLRIKNVELGYTFKPSLIKKLGISSTRIFMTGNNLYTWDKLFPGVDPESGPTGNTNQVNYPMVKTINFGLNVNF